MTPTPHDDEHHNPPPRASDLFARMGLPRDVANDLGEPADAFRLTPEETAAWNRERALNYLAKRTPARFATARTDNPAILDWVARFLVDPSLAESLLLLGPTGTGKTHHAFGAVRTIAESGRPPLLWEAVTASKLYGSLRPGAEEPSEAVYQKYARAHLLILDDIGAAKDSAFTEEATYRIVDHRYSHCLPTIFTTNLGIETLRAGLGDRTASRLAQICTKVLFDGPDVRRNHRPGGVS